MVHFTEQPGKILKRHVVLVEYCKRIFRVLNTCRWEVNRNRQKGSYTSCWFGNKVLTCNKAPTQSDATDC